MQVKLCQPAAMALGMDGKARPGRRGECVRGLMRFPRAAQSFSCAVLGVQFRCKIDSPARPLAASLTVICVRQMLQGSVGTGRAHDDVRKLLKVAGLRTLMRIVHVSHCPGY